MNKYTIVVAIGRGEDGGSDASRRWQEFKHYVCDALMSEGITMFQRPTFHLGGDDQVGLWEGDTEPAATFIGLLNTGNRVWSKAGLSSQLAAIGKHYGQQAIGLIVVEGDNHLVQTGL